jgi:hypothetical protein
MCGVILVMFFYIIIIIFKKNVYILYIFITNYYICIPVLIKKFKIKTVIVLILIKKIIILYYVYAVNNFNCFSFTKSHTIGRLNRTETKKACQHQSIQTHTPRR